MNNMFTKEIVVILGQIYSSQAPCLIQCGNSANVSIAHVT